MGFDNNTAGKAFALVIAAGAATGIGAGVVFFPQLVHLANRKALAIALGLSAGVMLYVSMVDIHSKAMVGFADSGHTDEQAFIYTSLCFFAGVFGMKMISIFTKYILGHDCDDHHHFDPEDIPNAAGQPCDTKNCNSCEEQPNIRAVVALEKGQLDTSKNDADERAQAASEKKLMKMGVATAVAIALHNLPEGLVTFVAYTEDPTVGFVLALGIALHNIPEGLCVSMPIYYATGNRLKAFLWGILSGVSEPLGALIGWLILGRSFSGNTYGILFGLVAGIMVFIAIDELLPNAYRYDHHGHLVTYSVFAGMFALSASLMLFSTL